MIRLVSSLFRRGTGIPRKVEKPGFTGAVLREQGSGIQPDAGGPSVASGSDHINEGTIMTREESMLSLIHI